MKKLWLIVLLFSFSTILYSQCDSTKFSTIKNQLDSLIIKYNVKTIDVSSGNGITLDRSVDFKMQNGFLIVNKTYYFVLNRIVSFYVGQRLKGTYYLSITFN